MARKELLTKICAQQIVGVVREDSADDAASVADAYAKHGIRIIEITLTTPDAFDLIATVSKRYSGDDVTLAAIDAYLDAGCIAVNLGISLAVPDLVRGKQWEEIGRRVVLATSIVHSRKNAMPVESAYIH